ncbi:hypothetical protein BC832DRAFT_198285 [Gaertneriomyces semiglobifer]|nr:hypothetical protein BC832DRAFT_198285 [Gaertneriomyces semiglobifer]
MAWIFLDPTFLRGLLFGTIGLLILEAVIIYRFYRVLADPARRFFDVSLGDRPRFARDFVGVAPREGNEGEVLGEDVEGLRGEREHHEPWPEEIVSFLRQALTPTPSDTPILPSAAASSSSTSTPSTTSKTAPVIDHSATALSLTENCHWLNVIANRYFLALRGSELFKSKMKKKWTEKINAKLTGHAFVHRIEIMDISLGAHAPKVCGVRLGKGVSDDLAVSCEVDVVYRGGGSIMILAVLKGGVKLPVRVTLTGFAGKCRLRFPSIRWPDMIGIAFVEDPGATFVVDSPITVADNEMLRSMVNKLLASVVRKVFVELWVMPSWRTVFMPLMEPKPADIEARIQAAKDAQEKAKQAHARAQTESKKKSRAATLWESRSPLLRHGKNGGPLLLGDVLENSKFPTCTVLTPRSEEVVKELESTLVDNFLKLATDRDEVESTATPASTVSATPSTSTATSPYPTTPVAPTATSPSSTIPTRPTSPAPPSQSQSKASDKGPIQTTWRTLRNRSNIHLEKKRLLISDHVSEITRASLTIQCDAERVYSVLSNPEHLRHVQEPYGGSEEVARFDDSKSVRIVRYVISKLPKEFMVFEVRRRLSGDECDRLVQDADATQTAEQPDVDVGDGGKCKSWIVVQRSVGGYDEHDETATTTANEHGSVTEPQANNPATDGTEHDAALSSASSAHSGVSTSTSDAVKPAQLLYLNGCLITATSPTTTKLVMISTYSPDMARLEVSYEMARKVKGFIEELARMTDEAKGSGRGKGGKGGSNFRGEKSGSSASGGTGGRRFFSEGSREMERLKSLVGGAGALLKRKRVGWLGGSGRQPSGEGSPTLGPDGQSEASGSGVALGEVKQAGSGHMRSGSDSTDVPSVSPFDEAETVSSYDTEENGIGGEGLEEVADVFQTPAVEAMSFGDLVDGDLDAPVWKSVQPSDTSVDSRDDVDERNRGELDGRGSDATSHVAGETDARVIEELDGMSDPIVAVDVPPPVPPRRTYPRTHPAPVPKSEAHDRSGTVNDPTPPELPARRARPPLSVVDMPTVPLAPLSSAESRSQAGKPMPETHPSHLKHDDVSMEPKLGHPFTVRHIPTKSSTDIGDRVSVDSVGGSIWQWELCAPEGREAMLVSLRITFKGVVSELGGLGEDGEVEVVPSCSVHLGTRVCVGRVPLNALIGVKGEVKGEFIIQLGNVGKARDVSWRCGIIPFRPVLSTPLSASGVETLAASNGKVKAELLQLDLSLPRKSTFRYPVIVHVGKMKSVEWEVRTGGWDVGVGLEFVPAETQDKQVVQLNESSEPVEAEAQAREVSDESEPPAKIEMDVEPSDVTVTPDISVTDENSETVSEISGVDAINDQTITSQSPTDTVEGAPEMDVPVPVDPVTVIKAAQTVGDALIEQVQKDDDDSDPRLSDDESGSVSQLQVPALDDTSSGVTATSIGSQPTDATLPRRVVSDHWLSRSISKSLSNESLRDKEKQKDIDKDKSKDKDNKRARRSLSSRLAAVVNVNASRSGSPGVTRQPTPTSTTDFEPASATATTPTTTVTRRPRQTVKAIIKQKGIVHGTYDVQRNGIVYLVVDNSYSVMVGKRVGITVWGRMPEE